MEQLKEDPFTRLNEQKRERVAKNQLHQMRNIARSRGISFKEPFSESTNRSSVVESNRAQRAELALQRVRASSERQATESAERKKAFIAAKRSTASIGQFDAHSQTEKQLQKTTNIAKVKSVLTPFYSLSVNLELHVFLRFFQANRFICLFCREETAL